MKINQLNFSFGKKKIFKNTSFESKPSGITVVMGKSGTGKSTLFNILSGELKTKGYKTNHQLISYVKQTPDLMYHLKMSDHIALIEKLYNKKINKELIKKLDLEKTLKAYPLSLSGGERLRWGLLLGVIKDKKYLLCDEPTASLDWKQKENIIDILKAYASEGHHVIVCSHDKAFLKHADKAYYLENHQLNLLFDKEKSLNERKHNKKKINLEGIHSILKKNRSVRNVFKRVLYAISIVVMCIGLQYDDNMLQINAVRDFGDELIVYKSFGGIERFKLLYDGREEQLSDEDIAYIESLDHVEAVKPMYQSSYYNYEVINDDNVIESCANSPLSIIKDGEEIVVYTKEESDFKNTDSRLSFDSYIVGYESQDVQENDLAEIYPTETPGVYINNNLVEHIKKRTGVESLRNYSLKFRFIIPMYQYNYGSGSDYINQPSDYNISELTLPLYRNIGKEIEIEIPIAGIVKDYKLGSLEIDAGKIDGQPYYSYECIIYIPNDLVFDYVKQYQVDEKVVVKEYKIDGTNDGGEYANPQILYPYNGNSMRVKIDDVSHVFDVADQIIDAGFSIAKAEQYKTSTSLLGQLNTSTFKALRFMFIAICIVVVIVNEVLETAQKQETMQFFKNNVHTKAQINHLMNILYYIETGRLMITMIIMVLLTYFVTPFKLTKWYFIPFVLLMCFIYEYLIPKMIGGKMK